MRQRMTGLQWITSISSIILIMTGVCISAELGWRWILILLGALLLVGFIWWRSRFVASGTLVGAQAIVVETQVVRGASVLKRGQELVISDQVLEVFGHLLLHPAKTRARVREQIDLQQEPVKKTTVVSIRLPTKEMKPPTGSTPPQPSFVLLPILRPVKRRLITNLTIADEGGNRLDSLNYEETLAVLARLAEYLLRKSVKVDAQTNLDTNQQRLLAFVVDTMILLPFQQQLASTTNRHGFRQGIGRQFDAIAAQVGAKDRERLADLRQLSLLSCCNYAVAAWVPVTTTGFSYTYHVSRRQNLKRETAASATSWFYRVEDWLRSWLRRSSMSGAPRVRVSVNKGNSCESYHLLVRSPASTHVGWIDLVDEGGARVPRPPQPSYDYGAGYFRVSGRSTGEAHLYARGLASCGASSGQIPMSLEVASYENPPGSLGRAVVVSALVLFAIYLTAMRVQNEANLNIDAFALSGSILAAILLIVGWVLQSPFGHPRVSAILPHLSLAISLAAIVAGAVMVGGSKDGDDNTDPALILGLHFFDVHRTGWTVLCIAAAANLLWGVVALVVRVRRLNNLARREAERNVDTAAVHEVDEPRKESV